jgi:NitT/TauT family transport system ATP-binding protein
MNDMTLRDSKVAPTQSLRPAVVEFRGVEKRFHVNGVWNTAVQGIDLCVDQGQVVTLVGPSGCGKSTLLNMAAGMYTPTSGRVLYRGEEVLGLNTRVGYMTQHDHLLPWRTVFDNIALPLEIKGLNRNAREERVHELIHLVGLDGFERYFPSQVSGGMKKRCALARLLAYDPEMLLMDEPFGALDAQMRLSLQIELLRISQQLGKTVLFVTHDLDEAIALAQRCVVFQGRPGQIAEVIDVDLPIERDLVSIRFDARYVYLIQQLWRLMAPELSSLTSHREKK